MKLAIIVGHTAVDGGAEAHKPLLKNEYEYNKEISIEIFRYAREAGLDCRIFMRDGMTRDQLGRQVNMWAGEDGVAIELHMNAFDTVVRGTETLYDALPTSNADFAQIVHKHVCKALGRDGKRDRGTKLVSFKERGWRNMAAVACTGCIVEPIFCDNREECRLMWNKRSEYCRALVDATLEWYCNT